MSDRDDKANRRTPVRREPPPFRRVTVEGVDELTPRLRRVTVTGDELDGLVVDEPAASVRLLVPPPEADEPVIPEWNGNEFLLPDGARPVIRTFTPRRFDPDAPELELWVVVHGDGAASQWASRAEAGAPAAISGTGRGYTVDPAAPEFLLGGDETALAAISQLVEEVPDETPVHVHVELGHPDARLDLPDHPRASVEWHELPAGADPGDALVAAVTAADLDPGAQVWAAGEAAAVQRIRKHLRDERDFPRSQTTVRGYWKHGRAG